MPLTILKTSIDDQLGLWTGGKARDLKGTRSISSLTFTGRNFSTTEKVTDLATTG